jgi:hypothetical protein
MKFTPHSFKEVNEFQHVDEEDNDERQHRKAPQVEVDAARDMEKCQIWR